MYYSGKKKTKTSPPNSFYKNLWAAFRTWEDFSVGSFPPEFWSISSLGAGEKYIYPLLGMEEDFELLEKFFKSRLQRITVYLTMELLLHTAPSPMHESTKMVSPDNIFPSL